MKDVHDLPWDWSSFLYIHFGSSGTSHWAWLMVGTQYTFGEIFTWVAQYFLYSRSQMFIIFLLIMRYFVHQCVYNISTCKNITNWSPLCPPLTLRNRTFHYLWNLPHFHTIFIPILLRSWPPPWTFFISSFSLEFCQICKYSWTIHCLVLFFSFYKKKFYLLSYKCFSFNIIYFLIIRN